MKQFIIKWDPKISGEITFGDPRFVSKQDCVYPTEEEVTKIPKNKSIRLNEIRYKPSDITNGV